LGNFIPPEVLEFKRKSNMANRVTFKREREEENENEASPKTNAGEVPENRDRIDSLENEDSFEEKNGVDAAKVVRLTHYEIN